MDSVPSGPTVCEMPGAAASVVGLISGNCSRKLASSSSPGFLVLVLKTC